MNFIDLYKNLQRLNQIIHSILFRFLGEPNWRYFLIHDLRALFWFDMEWKSDAYQWICDRMGSWRICDGEYQLYKILMAARHSNSQLEAISKTSNCHRRRWFDNFQGQKSVVYHLNRSHHFLPDEIQRLSFGPSSKNLILDTLWFHEFSDDFFFDQNPQNSPLYFWPASPVPQSVCMCIRRVKQLFITILKAD